MKTETNHPKKPWREVLGFPSDAIPDIDQVRRAHQRLAMLLHPDREGGDDVKMAELNVARDEGLAELGARR